MKPIRLKKIARRRYLFIIFPIMLALLLVFFSGAILRQLGSLIVVDEKPPYSDAVVILLTGVDYYPRLIQAADIYGRQLARKVVINGNRKTDILRELEDKGFERCCPWYTESVRILTMLGVAEKDIIPISAENAYDTVSEAQAVGAELIRRNLSKVIVTTSKFHTRRAKFIWQNMYANRLSVYVSPAASDPYDPQKWWKDGRQIRWVMAEYGAWIYYWWKRWSL
ncbi:MAG: YdcF family protein [Desulfobacterales bacterium]|nr:MAG: YdcF family protein [Desulfobacterales bacterium]